MQLVVSGSSDSPSIHKQRSWTFLLTETWCLENLEAQFLLFLLKVQQRNRQRTHIYATSNSAEFFSKRLLLTRHFQQYVFKNLFQTCGTTVSYQQHFEKNRVNFSLSKSGGGLSWEKLENNFSHNKEVIVDWVSTDSFFYVHEFGPLFWGREKEVSSFKKNNNIPPPNTISTFQHKKREVWYCVSVFLRKRKVTKRKFRNNSLLFASRSTMPAM